MVCIQLNSRLTMFCDPYLSSLTNVDIRSLWQSSSKLGSAHLAYREHSLKEQNLLRFKQLLFLRSSRSMGPHKTLIGLIFSCIYPNL